MNHSRKTSPDHAARTLRRLEKDAFPFMGRRPIAEITAPELLRVLRKVVDRGAIETAHRLRDSCGQVFRYGVACGKCERDSASDLRDALPPVSARHHAAIVDPIQAGELLRAISGYHGQATTGIALKLSALLMLRPGELRRMEWAWVDLNEAVVRMPGAVMKRRLKDKAGPDHIVPLARQAVALLRDLHALTGRGRYCFPALNTSTRPMSENTVNTALRRLGYDNETMTAHGFRAMARTLAVERLGIDAEVVEAQLAHAVRDPLGRAYNRTAFLEQRREMMTRWADYLDRLTHGGDVGAMPIVRGDAA